MRVYSEHICRRRETQKDAKARRDTRCAAIRRIASHSHRSTLDRGCIATHSKLASSMQCRVLLGLIATGQRRTGTVLRHSPKQARLRCAIAEVLVAFALVALADARIHVGGQPRDSHSAARRLYDVLTRMRANAVASVVRRIRRDFQHNERCCCFAFALRLCRRTKRSALYAIVGECVRCATHSGA